MGDGARAGTGVAGGLPLVSVIVPAWNAERTLAETLECVSAQTYPNIEIIIVDDGSTDGTGEIARRFCDSEPRARLVTKENGGVASARNRGIAESAGEWIAPIDSDDLWHPTRIERMMSAALAAREKPGYVYCWCRCIDGSGRITASGSRWPVEGRAFNRSAYLNVVGNGSGLLLSRSAILEIGGYDPSLRAENAQGAEDLLVQIRIARLHPIIVVREHLVGWRQAGVSMSSDAEQMDRSCRLVYRRLSDFGTPVPKKVEKRMIGASALDVSEYYAGIGKFVNAARWLGRAFLLDPVRCGLYIVYRIVRSVVRRAGPLRSKILRPFGETDPSEQFQVDPYRLDGFLRFMRNLELRRLDRLAEMDGAP